MKLASLRRGGRDGRLAVVNRDLTRCVLVPGIAPTMQAALDDWETVAPRLAERAVALEGDVAGSIALVGFGSVRVVWLGLDAEPVWIQSSDTVCAIQAADWLLVDAYVALAPVLNCGTSLAMTAGPAGAAAFVFAR